MTVAMPEPSAFLRYEPVRYHKVQYTEAGPPQWKPAKTKCPTDLDTATVERLLDSSFSEGHLPNDVVRYAARRTGKGLEFFMTRGSNLERSGKAVVHGFPVTRVPATVLRDMLAAGIINKAEYRAALRW